MIARAEEALSVNTSMERRSSLERELTQLDHELRRLSAAVAAGGELTSLIEALKVGEARREELRSDLESLTLRRAEFDAAKLRQQLDERLADWRGLLRRHPVQGQQVLKRHCQVDNERAWRTPVGSVCITVQQAHVTSSQMRNDRVLSSRW